MNMMFRDSISIFSEGMLYMEENRGFGYGYGNDWIWFIIIAIIVLFIFFPGIFFGFGHDFKR